jgi:hypothetical protein
VAKVTREGKAHLLLASWVDLCQNDGLHDECIRNLSYGLTWIERLTGAEHVEHFSTGIAGQKQQRFPRGSFKPG